MPSQQPPVGPESRLVEAYIGLDPVTVCSRLVAVLKDAAHGWRVAADSVAHEEIADHMRATAHRREEFAIELSNVIAGRSGAVTDRHTASGHLLSWWLEVRALTARDTTRAVLKVCQSGSRAAQNEYRHALDAALPDPIREIVVRQFDEIEATGRWLSAQVAERGEADA